MIDADTTRASFAAATRPPGMAAGALACLGLLAGLGGCASPSNPALEEARASVQAAQASPVIQENAPVPLREAVQALERAEAARVGGADDEEIVHLAYLADQRAAIAEARAVERASQLELETVGEARQQVLLQARTEQVEELEQQLQELEAERTERGLVVTLEDILFDVDRATLRPGAQDQLLRVANALQQDPGRNLLIEGHTDSTGSADYNLQLSQLRAEAVRDFLVLNGVAPEQIRAIGYGETRPEVSNDTAAGRQQNRRVEVVILDQGEPLPPPTAATFGG